MRTIVANTLCAIASLGLTAGIVAFADPAVAAMPDTAPRQAIVRTGDLDLHSAAGVATARRRIRAAATGVCAADRWTAAVSQCQKTAVANAERSLDLRVASSANTVLLAAR